MVTRRKFATATSGAVTMLALGALRPAFAQSRKPLRFAVGPFLPSAEDTRKAFGPVFAHVAKELGVDRKSTRLNSSHT